jgi:hypothetical protein
VAAVAAAAVASVAVAVAAPRAAVAATAGDPPGIAQRDVHGFLSDWHGIALAVPCFRARASREKGPTREQ